MEDRVEGLGFGAGRGSVSVAVGWQGGGSGWEFVGEGSVEGHAGEGSREEESGSGCGTTVMSEQHRGIQYVELKETCPLFQLIDGL